MGTKTTAKTKWSVHGTNFNGHVMIGEEGKEHHTGKIAHVIYNGEENIPSQWDNAHLICEAVNNYSSLKETNKELLRTLSGILNWHRAHEPISFIEEDKIKEANAVIEKYKHLIYENI